MKAGKTLGRRLNGYDRLTLKKYSETYMEYSNQRSHADDSSRKLVMQDEKNAVTYEKSLNSTFIKD